MAAKYPPEQGQFIHPTYAIDVIWRAHMIYPKLYPVYAFYLVY
jgi:hypothetical protein